MPTLHRVLPHTLMLMMKNSKNFQYLTDGRKELPTQSWPSVDLLMFCACECLYTAYPLESGEVTA